MASFKRSKSSLEAILFHLPKDKLQLLSIDLSRSFFNKREKKIIEALKDVNLQITKRQILGILGRNGAGKTTLIRILNTLLLPTSGKAFVLGFDVEKEFNKIRSKINLVSGGENPGYGILTVRENLFFFSQLYGLNLREAKRKIDFYIKEFGLKERAESLLNTLSTGEKQRLQLMRGLINDPEVLFLDEPTVGLDVEFARFIRNYVKEWVKEGNRTVILTTHYLSEVEELCKYIAIIDKGKILALDTPMGLKAMVQEDIVYEIEVSYSGDLDLNEIRGVRLIEKRFLYGKIYIKFSLREENLISNVLSYINEKGEKILFLRRKEPSLEEAFIKIVGRRLEDEE
ncbi:MAG: ATP-binding cassette domain-containing protein [Dictyoglomus sp.]